jgi:zinc transporter 7
VPNFILAFIPSEINANTLNTMTAFAVRVTHYASALCLSEENSSGHPSLSTQTGGLLSDVFLHLVPHSFMGESTDCGIRFVMVEEKRNILVG